jgi:hypothetical protein
MYFFKEFSDEPRLFTDIREFFPGALLIARLNFGIWSV